MAQDFLTPVTRTTLTGDICRKMVGHLIRGDWGPGERIPAERELEISIGFITAFFAALVVVGPFVNFVRRVGFAPFAWYRIVFGLCVLAAVAAGWL